MPASKSIHSMTGQHFAVSMSQKTQLNIAEMCLTVVRSEMMFDTLNTTGDACRLPHVEFGWTAEETRMHQRGDPDSGP